MNSILQKRVVETQIYLLIGIFALGLVLFARETSQAAAGALALCAQVLVPSLFPFFVVSSLCVQTGMAFLAGRAFEKPMRLLFGVPGACAPAFVLGLVGGYPVGAQAVVSLYKQGVCTKTEAERLLAFCNNCGPAFIFGAVGASMLGGSGAGALLYVPHILASAAVGVLFSLRARRGGSEGRPHAGIVCTPFSRAFTTAVTTSFSSVLNVCAFVIFFAVAIQLLHLLGVIPALANALNALVPALDPGLADQMLSGLLEVTSGVKGLLSLDTGMAVRLTAAAFLLGWAGLSVHCQVVALIGGSGLSPLPYMAGKALQGCLAALLTWLALSLFPAAAAVSGTSSAPIPFPSDLPSLFWPAFASSVVCWLSFAALSLLFRLITRCKNRGFPV